MRVILEHTGRLAIDIIPGVRVALHREPDNGPNRPNRPPEAGGHSPRPSSEPGDHPRPRVSEPGTHARRAEPQHGEPVTRRDLTAATAEEELFSVLMFLLRRTLQQTGQIPTHTVLDSAVRAFDILLTSGKLPAPNKWERSFLTVLLVALEQTAARHGREWLDELITHVRASIDGIDNPDDDTEGGDGTGNSEPDNDGPGDGGNRGSGDSRPGDGGSSGGSNGQITSEWKGSPRNGVPSLDTATTKPVKKKE